MRETLKEMIINAGYEVKEHTVFKNSAEMTAWCIKKENSKVAPNIYISEIENMSDEEAFDRIINAVENTPISEFNSECLLWKNVKDKVFLGIRRELPQDTNTVTKKILDMELIVKIPVTEMMSNSEMATVTLNESILQLIFKNEPDLTVEDIFETAKANTKYCGPTFDGIPEEIVQEMLNTLNVITTEKQMYGASVLSNADYLAEYCKGKGYDEMYILPSSIHEILCIFDENADPDELRTMVREVNATQVAPQEQLSDNVYYFNANTKELRIA